MSVTFVLAPTEEDNEIQKRIDQVVAENLRHLSRRLFRGFGEQERQVARPVAMRCLAGGLDVDGAVKGGQKPLGDGVLIGGGDDAFGDVLHGLFLVFPSRKGRATGGFWAGGGQKGRGGMASKAGKGKGNVDRARRRSARGLAARGERVAPPEKRSRSRGFSRLPTPWSPACPPIARRCKGAALSPLGTP